MVKQMSKKSLLSHSLANKYTMGLILRLQDLQCDRFNQLILRIQLN